MLAWVIGRSELTGLAASKERREITLRIQQMPRLAGLLAEPDACDAIRIDVEFAEDPEGLPQVSLAMGGEFHLVCQRCLGRVSWEVELDCRLTVLDEDEQIIALADPFESVIMDEEGLNLALVVEDEVLASLPLSPMHDDSSACGNEADPAADTAGEETQKPFADLARLMARSSEEGKR